MHSNGPRMLAFPSSMNPFFLVKKQSSGYRLVTAFADVGRYSKPQPWRVSNARRRFHFTPHRTMETLDCHQFDYRRHIVCYHGDKPHLADFFSAKLRGSQLSWLPCEIEALSIATAIKHFSPYIIQSNNNACVLTDSKPCVQAFEKLPRRVFRKPTCFYLSLNRTSFPSLR